MSELLGPNANPMVCIGGASAWKTRTIKGIMCSFQWLDLSGHVINPAAGKHGYGETCNPCMCLFNPRSVVKAAYIIPQQNAYRYGHKDGTPTQHLLTCGFQAAADLQVEMSRSAIRNVIDIIIEGLPDLILMPSEPPNKSEILIRHAIQGIEATAKINGKAVYEELL